jgi:hypothetical protein
VKVTVSNPKLVFGYPDWYFSKFHPPSWQIPGCASLCLDICLPNALQIIIHQCWYSACRLWNDDNFVKQASNEKLGHCYFLQQKSRNIISPGRCKELNVWVKTWPRCMWKYFNISAVYVPLVFLIPSQVHF